MDDLGFIVLLDDLDFDQLDEPSPHRHDTALHQRPGPILVSAPRCSRSLPFPRHGRGPPAIHDIHDIHARHDSHDNMDITLLKVNRDSTITGLHA